MNVFLKLLCVHTGQTWPNGKHIDVSHKAISFGMSLFRTERAVKRSQTAPCSQHIHSQGAILVFVFDFWAVIAD
jgi:hypothetical protein